MSNNNLDPTIDLDAIRQSVMNNNDEDTPVGSNWAEKLRQETSGNETDESVSTEDNTPSVHSEDEYDGPGMVVNTEDANKDNTPKVYTGLSKEVSDHISEYMAELDGYIEDLEENEDERKANVLKVNGLIDDESEYYENLEKEDESEYDNDDEDIDESMNDAEDEDDPDEFNEKYNEAVVIIDKTKFGTVINFTDEEREKLEKSKKIKLEEIENVSLETIKVKRVKKKDDFNKIINRVTNLNSTNIILPVSGYTAAIRGCSAYELISLIDDNKNAVINAQNKWSLIYNKLENTSVEFKTFDEFLHNTASADYNTFIYGLLCSTYPDDDELPVRCAKCKKEFKHKYSTKSLIRVEKMDDKLKDIFVKIEGSSFDRESAKEAHESAPISLIKRVALPVSGIIAEIYIQSAYDLINKSIKELQNNTDDKYVNTAVLSTFVKTFYIPDDDGSYFMVDSALDISKTLYNLSELDILVIRKLGDELLENTTLEYGLMDVTCPHCGHYTSTINIEIENILFYRYRQTLNTELE